jgi:hypothetical protein
MANAAGRLATNLISVRNALKALAAFAYNISSVFLGKRSIDPGFYKIISLNVVSEKIHGVING